HPARGFWWVSTGCPAAALFPGEKVEPFEGRLTHTGAVVVRPSAHVRVELLDQGALREGFVASCNPSKLRQMCCDVGLGGFEPGFKSQALTVGVFPPLLLRHSILTNVES